jgi:hypothetical protein
VAGHRRLQASCDFLDPTVERHGAVAQSRGRVGQVLDGPVLESSALGLCQRGSSAATSYRQLELILGEDCQVGSNRR